MEQSCPHCEKSGFYSGYRTGVVRMGFFVRKDFGGSKIARFRCLNCRRSFSEATFDSCYWQKKRSLNCAIYASLVSNVSQRQCARLLGIDRKTVVRKLIFLGLKAYEILPRFQEEMDPLEELQFDDMETFEHTKLKPLSITVISGAKSRTILDFRVSQMPAKGLLAKLSRKKYGFRKDLRKLGRNELFARVTIGGAKPKVIKSDENPHYAPEVVRYFPQSQYETFKSRRACVVGQGELKKIYFDPLFTINHTCASLRASTSRLIRRTWCTTKKPERLILHLALSVLHHNLKLKDPKHACHVKFW